MRETWVRSLGQEDAVEKGMATHSSILAWRTPWTEEPGRRQSMGSQKWDTTWKLNNNSTPIPKQKSVTPQSLELGPVSTLIHSPLQSTRHYASTTSLGVDHKCIKLPPTEEFIHSATAQWCFPYAWYNSQSWGKRAERNR